MKTYPQSGGTCMRSPSYNAIERLIKRGAAISARTKLAMQFVKQGWPEDDRIARERPYIRKAIEAAIYIYGHAPLMCQRMRSEYKASVQRARMIEQRSLDELARIAAEDWILLGIRENRSVGVYKPNGPEPHYLRGLEPPDKLITGEWKAPDTE